MANKKNNHMNNYEMREIAKVRRVKQHILDHPITPAIPALTAESTAVSTSLTQIDALAESQAGGFGAVTGAVDHRLMVVDNLLNLMRSLSKAAKVLDKDDHPDVAAKMRIGQNVSFEKLLVKANLFHSTLQPIEAEFIALGASATVAADLQALITELEGAGNLKLTGLDTQIGGTSGLGLAVRQALKHVRKIDAILCLVYRDNPVMLAQWKAARRTERAPKPAEDPVETPGGAGSGGGSNPPSGS